MTTLFLEKFFCVNCLEDLPISKRAPGDLDLCLDCTHNVRAEEQQGKVALDPSYWEEGKQVFVINGYRWALDKKTLATICLGPAVKDKAGKLLPRAAKPTLDGLKGRGAVFYLPFRSLSFSGTRTGKEAPL